MTGSVKVLLLTLAVLSIYSCEKDLSPEDLQIHFEGNFPLKDLVLSSNSWLACGGETFDRGMLVSGSFGGSMNEVEMIYSRCLNSIDRFEGTYGPSVFATGVYSVGVTKDYGWNFVPIPDLFILRETLEWSDHVYSVGGAGLSSGVIYKFDKSLNLIETSLLDNDLYFIRQIEGRIFAGGFGRLMYTDDFQDWTIIDEYEDLFIDVAFSEKTGLLVLGASGRIIQSKNMGTTWTEILSPNVAGISDLLDILVTDQKIFLAGDENICVSDIENIDWQTINFDSMGEINKMAENNERIYFVTSNGKMASIAH